MIRLDSNPSGSRLPSLLGEIALTTVADLAVAAGALGFAVHWTYDETLH